MSKYNSEFPERRRYVRLKIPVAFSYISADGLAVDQGVTKNISAHGLRFETTNKALKESDSIEMKLTLPGAANPVHAKAAVIWKKKLSLEDSSPFDAGVEFTEIEEDNKNTFLKNLCDLIYAISEEKAEK
jgi:hypothetical protein